VEKIMETVSKEFVKVPNWFFDEILPVAPNSFTCVLAFIFRKTIGWNDDEFKASIADISRASHVDKETVGRWLHVMRLVGWIEYRPARNGGGKSQIVLGNLADRKTARTVAKAIIHARELERKWSCENATVEQAEYNHYVEWQKNPRRGAAGFAGLMVNYLLENGFRQADSPVAPSGESASAERTVR
jgi:hypothetical protein